VKAADKRCSSRRAKERESRLAAARALMRQGGGRIAGAYSDRTPVQPRSAAVASAAPCFLSHPGLEFIIPAQRGLPSFLFVPAPAIPALDSIGHEFPRAHNTSSFLAFLSNGTPRMGVRTRRDARGHVIGGLAASTFVNAAHDNENVTAGTPRARSSRSAGSVPAPGSDRGMPNAGREYSWVRVDNAADLCTDAFWHRFLLTFARIETCPDLFRIATKRTSCAQSAPLRSNIEGATLDACTALRCGPPGSLAC
jgi:hypothetical protein